MSCTICNEDNCTGCRSNVGTNPTKINIEGNFVYQAWADDSEGTGFSLSSVDPTTGVQKDFTGIIITNRQLSTDKIVASLFEYKWIAASGASAGITNLTYDAATNTIINSSGTSVVLPLANSTFDGLLSKEDYDKLVNVLVSGDNISDLANDSGYITQSDVYYTMVGTSSPENVVLPEYAGQEYYDTTSGYLYISTGTAASNWVRLPNRVLPDNTSGTTRVLQDDGSGNLTWIDFNLASGVSVLPTIATSDNTGAALQSELSFGYTPKGGDLRTISGGTAIGSYIYNGTSWVIIGGDQINVVNALSSTSGTDALSANQGRVLNTTKLDIPTQITGSTKTKITYDSNGLITSGANLAAADIPQLPISNITNLQTSLDGKQDSLPSDLSGQAKVLKNNGANDLSWSYLQIATVESGDLASRPTAAAGNEGTVYVVAGDSTPENNGDAYISDGTEWLTLENNATTYSQAQIDVMLGDYILVSGTRSFTGQVQGITTTGASNAQTLTTKNYVDLNEVTQDNGSPVGVETPSRAGQLYHDLTSDYLYLSTDTGANDWTPLRGFASSIPSDTSGVQKILVNDGSDNISWQVSVPTSGGQTASIAITSSDLKGGTTNTYTVEHNLNLTTIFKLQAKGYSPTSEDYFEFDKVHPVDADTIEVDIYPALSGETINVIISA